MKLYFLLCHLLTSRITLLLAGCNSAVLFLHHRLGREMDMSKRLNLFFVLFLVGSTCHTAALPALVRTPTLMMQPSLDIKPFMSFPVDSSSAVGLFPNFNTVSKCIFMLSVSSSTSSVNSQFVFPKCNSRPCIAYTSQSCYRR